MGDQGRGMRRRDARLLRPLRLVVLLGAAAAMLYAPSAWATNYEVDNTADNAAQACTDLGVGDCSLRSAIVNANNHSGADTISFSTAVFTGVKEMSTITSSSATSMVIS